MSTSNTYSVRSGFTSGTDTRNGYLALIGMYIVSKTGHFKYVVLIGTTQASMFSERYRVGQNVPGV